MWILLGYLAAFLLLVLQKTHAQISGCDFFDTVDISTGQRLPNGSYLYEDLLIPAHLTAEYDFKLLANGEKEDVTRHIRGCVCKLRPCVRFCCPHDHIMDNSSCFDNMTVDELNELDPFLNVTLNNGSVVRMHFRDELIVQWDLPKPCEQGKLFYLDNRVEMDKFTLFENGGFLRHYDNMNLDKREYCLQHQTFYDVNTNTSSIRIAPHNCLKEVEQSRTGQTVVIILSLICMTLTTEVYLFVKEFRNLNGKCFISYMVCLFLAYLFLLLDLWGLSSSFCHTSGFLGYFFVMAAFLWLSVISLYLWNGLKIEFVINHQYLVYNCYAWGMSTVLTGITYVANEVVEDENWNPRMGEEGHCWIYTKSWSAMLYFYGPMLVLILFNMTLFILTALPRIQSKMELRKIARKEGRIQKLKSDKHNYALYLRLFIAMGISWSLEIISYLIQENKAWAYAFLVADYFNWSQGIIIFVLFILRGYTLQLLKKQIYPKDKWNSISMRSRVTRITIDESVSHHPNPTFVAKDSISV
ncbi:probable G-protein coupled receptor Mth-like 2 [Drosophila takahashii]|uniref:probable G-protein coupled receptor Mth-like 2 n=1 Tax=Drosophila takahashii TaxID=29030 RepID=UPI001CF8C9C1|nr:probable G-protein coupled receptor Mth-like 2 [Drosophila takahashii]